MNELYATCTMPGSAFTRESTVFNNGQATETPRGLQEEGVDLSLSPGNRSTRQEEKGTEDAHDPKCKAGGSGTVRKHDLGDHY